MTSRASQIVGLATPGGERRLPASGRLRILVHGLNFWPDVTGVAKYTFEMAEWLAVRGHRVRVVTAPPYYPEWKVADGYRAFAYARSDVAGVHVLRCPLWVPQNPGAISRLVHALSFRASSWIPVMREAAAWRPDLVWTVAPSMVAAPAALRAARSIGAPAWLHVQDLEADAAFALGILGGRALRTAASALESRFLRRFDRVSTISEAMLRRLVEKGCDPERTVLVPNWVDVDEIRPLQGPNPFRSDLGIGDGDLLALYAGNMGRKQGLPLIVRAAEMSRSLPRLRFVLAGAGSERAALEAAAAHLPNVSFLPLQPAERLPQLLSAADIHLLPQLAHAAGLVLPSKLMGMMASGRPVVATAETETDLAREVAPNGLVTPPGDAEAFAAAIAHLAADEGLRHRLGRAGRQRARRKWDRDNVLAGLEARFLDLARQAVATPAESEGTIGMA